ncbi:MAG: DUF2085 domain-containing protein, partial [Thermoplasmata archaeon]|nr:DUF2085 domain-containing protein [Thermoplasmata archaeon]
MRLPNKASLAVLVITVIWLLLLVITPFTIPPHTVEGLHGGANRIDYSQLWDSMPPVTKQTYWFGDFNCHQWASRSFVLNHNQLAVCARDVGMFIGLAIGALLMLRVEVTEDVFETGIHSLPKKIQARIRKPKTGALILFAIAVTPLAFDGFLQLLTP